MKAGGPLKRRKRLERRTRMRQRRRTPRRSERVRDVAYMLAVKALPCCAPRSPLDLCAGPVEADHAGVRPLGRKCSDHETIPLCAWHHIARHDRLGSFLGWSRAQVRAWLNRRIAETQALLAHLLPTGAAA